jgi:hypothetical protein
MTQNKKFVARPETEQSLMKNGEQPSRTPVTPLACLSARAGCLQV